MARIVSSDRVIARVQRIFKPSNADWVIDAIETIKTGLDLIGNHKLFCDKYEIVCVKNFVGKLPCRFSAITLVTTKGGAKLERSNVSSIVNHNLILEDKNNGVYKINGNVIHAPFKDGELVVYFKDYITDSNNYPMIPDTAECMIFLSWLIMQEMLASGYKHPVFDYAKVEYEAIQVWLPKAQNSLIFEEVDDMEQFKQARDIIHYENYFEERFFNNKG